MKRSVKIITFCKLFLCCRWPSVIAVSIWRDSCDMKLGVGVRKRNVWSKIWIRNEITRIDRACKTKCLDRDKTLSHIVPFWNKNQEYSLKITSKNPTYLARKDFEGINISVFFASPELVVMNLSRCATLLLPQQPPKITKHETNNTKYHATPNRVCNP